MNSFGDLAKAAYKNPKLTRPDWTVDISRPEGPLWLNKNENIDPILNEKIQSLIHQVKNYAINTYPETAKIYEKLARLENLKPKNFILTNGSDGAIRSVYDVFIEPGDRVLHTQPTFAMYDVYSKMYGADQIVLDYSYTDRGPILNFSKMLDTITELKPKLVCLPNPDSPTGTVLTDEGLNSLFTTSLNARSLLLIDEAYYPFYAKTVLSQINKFPNLLVCRSFSKAWGAAGFRVGFLAGAQDLMEVLHKNRAMYEVSTFSSELLNLLLNCKQDVLDSVGRLEEGRQYFISEMNQLGYKTTVSHGNFLHVNFGTDETKISEVLKGVVLYRTEFNNASCMKGFSRFSLGTKQQFEKIVEKIRGAK